MTTGRAGLLALGLLLAPWWLAPAAPGSWIATGSLNTTGFVPTAVPLHNGKVLALSGTFGFQSELYDPATGTWTSLGVVGPPLDHAAAVVLRDGRVLAVGGADSAPSAVCRLFDPATSTWTGAGSLNVAREHHTLTLLDDGRVLAVGGRGPGFVETTSAEIYDPGLDSWTSTGSLSAARHRHTATLLPDGRVMVAGGRDGAVPLTQTEVFDPAGGSWATPPGALGTARYDHTATLLPNGLVLAVGGNFTATAELFDPGPGTWSPAASLPSGRFQHSATLLPSGLVLVAGGQDGTRLKSAHVYDHVLDTWSPTAPAPGSVPDFTDERSHHAATMQPDGRVLMVGGTTGAAFVQTAELYDPDLPSWTAAPNMSGNRSEASATLLKNGRVLVAGGASLSSAEVFDPTGPGWTPTLNNMTTTRWRHSATLLLDGRVLVAGSRQSAGAAQSADLYDPVGNTWAATGNLVQGRSTHSAALLPNGEVLIVGGQDNASFILASAERYDPGTGTWQATTSMGIARWRAGATLLMDGRVLVTGGYEAAALDTAEIYDPATETWTTVPSTMTVPRYYHTSTLLPSGKVLLAGGGEFDVDPAATSAEIYDPATQTFSPTGSLNVAHESFFTATLLTNGRVLVLSGDANSTVAELYDPVTGTWTLLPGMGGDRWAHAASLLPDGRVLVAGSALGPIGDTAQVFDVGRGEDPSWRPVLATATDPLAEGGKLVAGGTQFQGISEASSGFGFTQSATNYPLVQLRRLDNEQVRWLEVDPANGWSDTSFTSVPLFGLVPGPALVTVFTNGVPSDGRVIEVGCSAPIITTEPVAVDACVGAPSSFTVVTTAVAPAFEWRKGGTPLVDGGAISGATTDMLSVNPTSLVDAGSYDVVVTTCGSTTSTAVPLNVFANLSNVMASLSGSSNICATCLGGTATESHSDGGPATYQWGYRLTSGGSTIPIPGEMGTSYVLKGSDFPGVGSYYLVVRTSPFCGTVEFSNEIPVTITATVPGDDVLHFTVTSRSGENVLEWVNPPSYDTTRIRFTQGPSCVPPVEALSSGTLLVDKTDLDGPGDRDRYVHGGRVNGETYCYSVFVDTGGATYSAGRSNRGRPMDTTGPIKWAFSTGVFSIAAPTVGGAGVIAASNEPVLHAMERGVGGGEWPASWLPMPLMGPVQSRSPIVPVTVGGANPVAYLSSQDGHVHVVDGVQGGVVGYPWSPEPLGTFPTLPGQAAPAVMLTAFGGTYNYLLAGTRDTGNDNRVYVIDPIAGGAIDFFDNGGGASAIGIVNGMGSVDYATDRFLFASHDAGGGSLWSVDLLPFPPNALSLNWSRALGDIDSSPVLSNGAVYVGSPLAGGRLYAVEATNAMPVDDRTFPHNDGQVKGFVFPDRASGDLYFATDSYVWGLNDNGTTITDNFSGGITLAGGVVPTSGVLFTPGSHYVYVGGSDGRLYEIDVSGGAPVIKSVVLGDGQATVGSPSLDWPNDLIHVGTEAGVFYAVQIPFP